ncbi:membrane-spanning 4-domains subfamily A member 4A-like [Chelmon rostratus]|uniref:membrane-spanning 4-domains subfamily A member 4A-like n=1 Tax=Chelmon rostratus TaxID=109905 RepID=UPI001BE9D02E|nr:membrane-spanning 4-domains subfamily A member 4A-like [Chelmon rostratus]
MTSITKIGGVVVVTQVIPQDEASIPLRTPASTQVPPTAVHATPTTTQPTTKVDDMTAAFLRGEPRSLGVVQIFIGLLCILFSLTAVYSPLLMVHAPFGLAASFVVSGSLAVAAARRTSIGLVWACLLWNVISVLLGVAGAAYLCRLLADRSFSERFCDAETWGGVVPTEKERTTCMNDMWILNVSVYGPLGVLLVLHVLQVCVGITVCVFSGKAIGRRDRYTPITVEVDDSSALLGAAASTHGSDVALLDGDGEETRTSPPNSP